jgi:hypothetical protein
MMLNHTMDTREVTLDLEYPVLISIRKGEFELRIAELFLIVRDRNIEHAFAKLVDQKRLFVCLARSFGLEHQVPAPSSRPWVKTE